MEKTKAKYRTLIVDDELLIRHGIKHYLKWDEFQIVGEAANGREALELIESLKPHIVLTDIVMPIMDGEELTRVIKEKYPHIEVIILSSFGEFHYVRSAFQCGVVDYILKPNLNSEELLSVLKKAAKRIPELYLNTPNNIIGSSIEHFLEKVLAGHEVRNEQIATEYFPYQTFFLLGIDMKQIESSSISTVNEKVSSLLQAHEIAFYPIKTEVQKVIIFLINSSNDFSIQPIISKLTEWQEKIGIVKSDPFEQINELRSFFDSLLSLIQYRFYFPDRKLLVQHDLPATNQACQSFNLEWFTEELTHERFDSAFTYLKQYSEHLSSQYMLDITEYKAFFSNIIFNIIILLGNMKCEIKEVEKEKYSYFRRIEDAYNAKEVISVLFEFITKVNESLLHHLEAGTSNIKILLEYIDRHYMEPLTLTGVAKHFHFNPSYLSNYFSTHNKEGFIEYVNKIRIEQASKKLLTTNLPISEISTSVGYSDHSYFCKVFKKQKGISPSGYRRKMK